MKVFKTIKSRTALIFVAAALLLSVCTSAVCNLIYADNIRNKAIDTAVRNAKNAVIKFDEDYSYNRFLFTDKLYSKANTISVFTDKKASAEENEALVRNLYLNSFVVTDNEGKIVSAYPTEQIGKNMLDDEKLSEFKANLKGIKFKSISTPIEIDGEKGSYSVMACISRSQGGVVIIDAKTEDYYKLSGKNISEYCNDCTIIARDNKIISSSIETDKTYLKELGINESKLKGDKFTIKINGAQYIFKADTEKGYTVISGEKCTTVKTDMILSVVIPLIASAIIFLIIFIIMRFFV